MIKIEPLSSDADSYPNDLCAVTRRYRQEQDWNRQEIDLGGLPWNLFPEAAHETYISPANNDCGRVKTPFLLEGLRDVTIDGRGARLLVRGSPLAGHGRTTIIDAPVVPFVIRNCENVTLRDLSIDWATPSTIQGNCIRVENGSFDVALETSQRVWAWNGQLYVVGEGWTWPVRRLLSVDPGTGAVVPGTGDNFGGGYDVNWIYEMLDEHTVRITGTPKERPQPGNKILFWCTTHDTGARRAPAIFIEQSRNVRLENIRLHFTWGMGVIAQASKDLTFDRVVVEPSGARRFSLASDGIHAVSCRGTLTFTHCRMQNQFDDAINIHSLYSQIVRVMGPRKLRIRTCHAQHQGVVTLFPGDRLRLCRQPHIVPAGEVTLEHIEVLNSETSELTFREDLPAGIAAADVVENLSANPDVNIQDCTFRWNRARGILLNGSGRIVVERNHFSNPGSAILVESSAEWGEAGPLEDLRILNNVFEDCTNCPPWGVAVIQILPDFRPGDEGDLPPFHGAITIRGNSFTRCEAPPYRIRSARHVKSE